LRQALQAVALDPYFVPAVALAARLCGATGRVRKGAKLIETAWSVAPHPDLADAYMALVDGESAYERFKRLQLLAGRNRDHVESRVALARAAIGARDWLAARGALEGFIGAGAATRPTQRICELMAEIEEGEFGNRGSAREWLSRALHAPEDPAWAGEGWRSHDWSPINPVTGEFDALEWRVPGLRLGSTAQVSDADDGADEFDAGMISLDDEDDASTDTEVSAADAIARMRSAGGAANKDGGAPEETDDEAVAFPPLLPDDPGPEGLDDLDEDGPASRGEAKW
jgi:HemY protein